MTDSYLEYRRIARVAALALLVAAFSGCSKKPEVTGEVLDGFGKPLAGATVAVDKTTFATTTDNGGAKRSNTSLGKCSSRSRRKDTRRKV